MSKKYCCNDNNCCDPCCNYSTLDYNNAYLWILIIILLYSYGTFWNSYNEAFTGSTFNSQSFSNSPSGNINNFFGSNSPN